MVDVWEGGISAIAAPPPERVEGLSEARGRTQVTRFVLLFSTLPLLELPSASGLLAAATDGDFLSYAAPHVALLVDWLSLATQAGSPRQAHPGGQSAATVAFFNTPAQWAPRTHPG